MICPHISANEPERLRALALYRLTRGEQLAQLQPVVDIAARMFGMAGAAVNIIGEDEVFFAAAHNIGTVDMRRSASFCAHAINQDGVMVVPDARQDERFHDNPLVTGPANLRFYAGVPLRSPQGHALGALCVVDGRPHPDFSAADGARLQDLARMAADRLELRRIESAPDRGRPAFRQFASASPTPVLWFDEDGRLTAWNDAALYLFGHTSETLKGCALKGLLPDRLRAALHEVLARAAAGNAQELLLPWPGLHCDGHEFACGWSFFAWRESGVLHFNALLQDAPAAGESAALSRFAGQDVLTGLANRRGFYQRVQALLERPGPASLALLDLNGFKDINDVMGQAAGDGVLCEIATRLQCAARAGDAVARIGGDEFALLLPGITEPALATQAAQRVLDHIAAPINLGGQTLRVTASCGVALAPLHAAEALELIGAADLALFKAKSAGLARPYLYNPALRRAAADRRHYGMELFRAVSNAEFILYYQPQIRLADSQLMGAEALIRWRHPERGLLPPAAFLPTLENGPLAGPVGAWVMDEACAQTALWRRGGAEHFRIGVNLFGAQLAQGDLTESVAQTLHRNGLPAAALELEITENVALNQEEMVLPMLQELRAQGVGVAFDDFGTGYASLSLLKRYPVSRLKIDRSFVNGMMESKRDASVVHAILDMARDFELDVIAEGVETEGQCAELRREGSQEAQGYLFGKPMPAALFAAKYQLSGGAVAA